MKIPLTAGLTSIFSNCLTRLDPTSLGLRGARKEVKNMNIYKKFAAGAASAILLTGMFATSVLAADLTISGNGIGSNNSITVLSTSNCLVGQNSDTNVLANISSSVGTGGNQANGNTGGSVNVTSGNGVAVSGVLVVGGSNTATNPCCCDQTTAQSVAISGNGIFSKNTTTQVNTKSSFVAQSASTGVFAGLNAKVGTGKNQSSGNTGTGTVSTTSGNGISGSVLIVKGGSNTLK